MFFTADTPQSELKPDGMMSLGADLPEIVDLPRVVMGGRRTEYISDIRIGAKLLRESRVRPALHKSDRSGKLAIVTVEHRISVAGAAEPAIFEEQDFIFRAAESAATGASTPPPAPQGAPEDAAEFAERFAPDETLVFRDSALTYNTHRIHYDHPYAPGPRAVAGSSSMAG